MPFKSPHWDQHTRFHLLAVLADSCDLNPSLGISCLQRKLPHLMWHLRLHLPSEIWSWSSDWSVESNTWAPGFLWGNSERPSQHWGSWEAFVATAFSLTPSFVQSCSPYSLGNVVPTDMHPQISFTRSFLSQAETEKNNLHIISVHLDGKASACNAGDPGSIPGSGRSPGGGNSNPLQHSCLENPMEGGAW